MQKIQHVEFMQQAHTKECFAYKCNRNCSETKRHKQIWQKNTLCQIFVTLDRSTPRGVFQRDRPENWNKSISATIHTKQCKFVWKSWM